MYTYSIMPLTEKGFDETVKDIKDQFERGISTVPLLKMTLVPEGNPVWDKADKMCRLYAKYKEALEPYGVKTGILVQASLGHGYKIVPNPYQKMVNPIDGSEEFVCCPEDPAFLEHFTAVMKRIAMEHPYAIMLDDDFRIITRAKPGCACPRHMAMFNEATGLSYTREQLYNHIITHPIDDEISVKYFEIQKNSLVKAAKMFREVIDSIDPSIQGIICVNGNESDISALTSKVFAGKGNPSIARVPNGSYAPNSLRHLSSCMSRAAISGTKLRENGVDILIAETDTIPFNRYGKSSRYLHSQYTSSLIEGMSGAKHWITRFTLEEQNSGKSHREMLAKHKNFYEKVSSYAQNIQWLGINSYFTSRKVTDYRHYGHVYEGNSWILYVIERMGLPFYFLNESGKANFLDGDVVREMSDSQIEDLFKGSVFTASDSAKDLIERGFGKYLGTDIEEWDLGNISGETFDKTAEHFCTSQKNAKKLVPCEGTEVLTYNFRREDEKAKLLAPAVTMLQRDDKISVVYSGTPKAEFNYMEGFAFLNESRKKQFVKLLKKADALPVYYPGDNEIMFRAGILPDGRMLTYTVVLGTDPEESLELYLEKTPECVKLLNADGTESEISFEETGESTYTFDVRCETYYPVVLLIDFE